MSQFRSEKRQTLAVKGSPLVVLAFASFLSATVLSLTQTASFAQFATPVPQEASPASSLGSAYVLGAGDQVQINMYGQEELFATPYTVLVDGTISLPFIGRVNVGGSTINDAQIRIAQRYTQFFKRPYVTVVLVQPREIKVTIAGEVLRPGPYPLAAEEEDNPTVSSLIKLAGGHTQSADLQRVEIRRPQQGGSPKIIQSDVMRLIRNGDGSQNYFLRDGDTVIVPSATQPEFAASSLLSDTSLSPEEFEPLNVAVVGEVYRPGPYIISSTDAIVQEAGDVGTQNGVRGSELPTVSQAIQRAGGIKPEADVRKIAVKRQNRVGAEQIIEVDLWKLLQEGDLSQDIALQSRDTIIIPKAEIQNQAERIKITESTLAPESISINVVGEVRNPGLVQVSPNTPLTQAVLSAGGFDSNRANKKSVDLIRMAPDGSVSQRRIALNFNGKIDEETNPVLKNNDVVVIRRSGLTKFSDGTRNVLAPFGALNFLRIIPGI